MNGLSHRGYWQVTELLSDNTEHNGIRAETERLRGGKIYWDAGSFQTGW